MNKFIFSTLVFVSFCGIGNVNAQKQTDSIPPSGNVIIQRGIELFDNGKYDEAIKTLKQVSPCDPSYPKSCYETALIYDNLGKSDFALQKCQEALDLDPKDVQICILKGSILDELGRRAEAIKWLETIEKQYPYNQNLLYNLAVCHMNNGELEKAEEILIRGLHYNPYHASSHIALGKINYMMGRKAQSYLAYNMGIIMNPRIEYIKNLEGAISGKNDSISKGYRYPYSTGVEHSKWDNLTGLLNAEVAFREDFPYNYDLNFLSCRQTFLLCQTMMFDASDTTLYNQFYVRFFRTLIDSNEFETFLYYSLKNSDNKLVSEWHEKHKESIDKFINHSRESINLWKEYGFSIANEDLHQQKYHFSDKGNFISVGILKETPQPSKEGIWYFISESGDVSQKGHYQNNERNGEFLIYWPDGSLKQKLNYKNDNLNGENCTYYPNATKSGVYPRNDGITEGVEEEYNSASKLVSSTAYKRGKIEGTSIYVDYDNGFRREIPFNDNKRVGVMTETWLNSNKKTEAVYADSLLNGTYRKWYSNGQPEWEGIYKKSIQIGKWVSYFANGTKSAEGNLDEAGNPIDGYTEYDRQGRPIQNISGYKNGKPDGNQIFYFSDGKEAARFVIQEDIYKHIDCFKLSGEKIYSADEKEGELNYKYFFPEGTLKIEGKFKDGQKDGIWKSYNVLGKLTSEESWVGGVRNGLQKYYHENGNPELVYACDSGKISGKVIRYFRNGHTSSIGYYDKEGPTGEWVDYYQNDSLASRYFYVSGKLSGRRMSYSPEGKLAIEEVFNADGESVRIKYFNGEEKLVDELNYPFGSASFMLHFPNGKTKAKLSLSDRRKDGIQEYYFPNGQLKSQQTFISGNAQGKSLEWDYRGKLVEVRNYSMNELDGKYFEYENGTLSLADFYEMGNNQGLYQEFHPNGKVFRNISEDGGERQGSSDCFAPDSTWMYGTQYRNDELYSISYFDSQGNLHANELIDNSKKGIICYYKNGKIAARVPLFNCIFNGKHAIYYSNGQLLREISYVNDYREGQSTYYYENGKMKESCDWKNGARHGHFTSYYANGQKEIEGNYLANKKQGKWFVYSVLGKLTETLNYENDELYEIN
jgi:uncharacterized protein